MRCAVIGCKSDSRVKCASEVIQFFRFPKDKTLNKVYKKKCQRSDTFETKDTRICSKHFTDEDYVRQMKYELLQVPCPKNTRKLKADAVPSLNLFKPSSCLSTCNNSDARTRRQQKREYSKIVKDLLNTER
ncbi:hypothetical protein ABEB36_009619 [Hypothenemus hampei]|uniref:THAP-type domain-containing protein n=1 Tax=Hypothenemus hampei TaxID=57062 RepID=A0ABD1EH91_HYPHA